MNDLSHWPELPALTDWQKTLEAVHLWSQIIGKIKLVHMPILSRMDIKQRIYSHKKPGILKIWVNIC